jgi:hypothetical protein
MAVCLGKHSDRRCSLLEIVLANHLIAIRAGMREDRIETPQSSEVVVVV